MAITLTHRHRQRVEKGTINSVRLINCVVLKLSFCKNFSHHLNLYTIITLIRIFKHKEIILGYCCGFITGPVLIKLFIINI